jgi:hypothetical protein
MSFHAHGMYIKLYYFDIDINNDELVKTMRKHKKK